MSRRPPARARKARARLERPPRPLPPSRYPWRTRAVIWLLLIIAVMVITALLTT